MWQKSCLSSYQNLAHSYNALGKPDLVQSLQETEAQDLSSNWLMWSWDRDSWHPVCIQTTVPPQIKLATKCWEKQTVVQYCLQIKEPTRSWTRKRTRPTPRIPRNSGCRLRICEELGLATPTILEIPSRRCWLVIIAREPAASMLASVEPTAC